MHYIKQWIMELRIKTIIKVQLARRNCIPQFIHKIPQTLHSDKHRNP
jgi:hypothetical protein